MRRVLQTMVGLVICLVILSPPASAAGEQTSVERDLDQAKVLYRDGRLDEAVAALRDVVAQLNRLRDQQSRKTQLAEAHLYLGLSYFAVRDESAALENFRQVVALDPSRSLDPEVYSPRVMSLFEQARADIDAARTPEASGARPTPRDREIEATVRKAPEGSLQPGTKLRLQFGGAGPVVTGNLVVLNEKTLTLVDAENQNLSFPRDMVTRVEVTRGRRSHWLMGAAVGAVIGVVGGAFEKPGCDSDGTCYTRAENIGYAGAGLALIGALAGALYRTDQWVEVSVDRVAIPTNGTADRKVVVSFAWRY